MTTLTDPTAADNAVLRALCWPSPPGRPHLPGWPIRDSRAGLGSLYGGRGARQFSDIDLLLAPADITVARTVLADLGYSRLAEGTALARHVDDILVPRIIVDLTPSVLHAHGEDEIRKILSRRTWQPLPGSDQPLPILAGPDALLHCLARFVRVAPTPGDADAQRWSICADASAAPKSSPSRLSA